MLARPSPAFRRTFARRFSPDVNRATFSRDVFVRLALAQSSRDSCFRAIVAPWLCRLPGVRPRPPVAQQGKAGRATPLSVPAEGARGGGHEESAVGEGTVSVCASAASPEFSPLGPPAVRVTNQVVFGSRLSSLSHTHTHTHTPKSSVDSSP
eukprot:3403166-Pyramimonas_sp.AAC.2